MNLTALTPAEVEAIEEERREGGRVDILAQIPDIRSDISFVQAMRHHFGYISPGHGTLMNADYVIKFFSGTGSVTITHIIILSPEKQKDTYRALRQLLQVCDSVYLKLRVMDNRTNVGGISAELLRMDKFYRTTDHGDKYLMREPQKFLYSTKLTADLTLGELDYSYQEVDIVKQDHRLDRDVDIENLRDDEFYVTLQAHYLYENREEDAKRLLMERMTRILDHRRNSARVTCQAIDKIKKEASADE